jgi:phosphohistidine phosphatase SixA
VLRHGHAVARDDWRGTDRDRPLRASGRTQAVALVRVARTYGVDRILSSPAIRCVQTIAHLLTVTGVHAELWPGLGEDGTADQFAHVASVVGQLLTGHRSTVVCSHRPVLPKLFEAVAHAGGPTPPVEPLRPGEYIVIRGADLLTRGRN